jgi:hypothetical protein
MTGILYMLGGRSFTTKAAIKQYIRQIIAGQKIGSTVTDPVLVDLLHKHPQWEEKSHGMARLAIQEIEVLHASIRCKAVVVEKSGAFVAITWSRLVDRLQRDGSLRQLDGRAENLAKIKVAARAAIQYQVLKVEKMPGDHIDHVYPRTFDRLLFLFLKWWGVPIAQIRIDDPDGSVIQIRFTCTDLETNWQIFHQQVARLRAVPEAINMSAPIYPVNWAKLP